MKEVDKKYRYYKELNFVKSLIQKAYKKCIYNKKRDVSIKVDKTVVTNLDINTERFLIQNLKNKFKNDNFLTEETNNKTKLGNRTWIIDPIDGTSLFIRNSAFYDMQIAFYDKNETQFSIIFLPMLNEIYVAIKGHGAYLNGQKIHRMCNTPMKKCNVNFNNIPYNWPLEIKEKYEKLYNDAKEDFFAPKFLTIDCSGVQYALLAKGVTDFLVEPANTKWDYMPGDLLAKEVGANYYNFDNEEFTRYYSFSKELDDYLGLTNENNKKWCFKFLGEVINLFC